MDNQEIYGQPQPKVPPRTAEVSGVDQEKLIQDLFEKRNELKIEAKAIVAQMSGHDISQLMDGNYQPNDLMRRYWDVAEAISNIEKQIIELGGAVPSELPN